MSSLKTYLVKAYGASSPTSSLADLIIPRRETQKMDVKIEILYCGVCHSDLHYVRNEWSEVFEATYPAVPGHEIVGRVVEVGAGVSKHRVGDLVGVGCMVDADLSCPHCQAGLEQYSDTHIETYGAPDQYLGGVTHGGYSECIVVHEHFVLRVPENLELSGVGPLLCAGITTYSPLRHWKVGPGMQVGIVGLGGLGHMAVKFARAFGAEVTVFTTSASKVEDALRLGAHHVVLSKDKAAMKVCRNSLDFILDAVSAEHDVNAYLRLLKVDGTLVMVGLPQRPVQVSAFSLLAGRRQIAGSTFGGIPETQEMLDFCGEHNITADVEVIKIQQINEAYERMLKGDVKYRFSIEMASLKEGVSC